MNNIIEIEKKAQVAGFKDGFTFGRIYQSISDGKDLVGPEVDFFIRKEIKYAVEKICKEFGYKPDIDGPYLDGWCRFAARKIES